MAYEKPGSDFGLIAAKIVEARATTGDHSSIVDEWSHKQDEKSPQHSQIAPKRVHLRQKVVLETPCIPMGRVTSSCRDTTAGAGNEVSPASTIAASTSTTTMRHTDSILEKGGQSLRLPVLAGSNGARESAPVFDPLLQSESGFDYTVLIEAGATSGICSQAHGLNIEPITFHPRGSLTINYLDTGGLPLTPLHLSMTTALVSRMVGLNADEAKQEQRRRQIARYLNQLYEDSYQDWVNRRPERVLTVARHACALAAYRRRRLTRGSTFLDAFVDFRDWRSESPEQAFAFLASFDDSKVVCFSKEKADVVRNLAFAYFTRVEYPTHRMLQELMYLDASGTYKEPVHRLAELLLPWCRGGDYGELFDGGSNITLPDKIAHFDLNHVSESPTKLRSAIGFLIVNAARQHVITLPRSQRKRIVCSGTALFFDDLEEEKTAKQTWEQMRKFNCSIVKYCSRLPVAIASV